MSPRILVAVAVVTLGTRPAAAQTATLTLADAIRIATDHSESLEVARTSESRANADQQRSLSQKLPQINFSGAYTRTLASEFSGAFQSTGPICAPLAVDPAQPLDARVGELERAASCGAIGPSLNFGNLPFGRRNIYQGTLTFEQALYAGGRITAQQNQANLSRRIATYTISSAEAQVALDVTQAFYDAALSDRLLAIAQSGYEQANATFDQTRLSFEAGRQPEFELLRSQVARDNQRPAVIRNRANRDIAYLRLRQLLELPADAPLSLDVDLDAPSLDAPAPFAETLAAATTTGATIERVGVHQAEALVAVREAGVVVARAERLPTLGVNSSLGRVGYPSSGAFPGVGDFRTNWSLSANVQVPVFTGPRLKADELTARADLREAQAQLKQSRELAVLDTATALQDLEAARASWEATAGTIEQAQRAYEIAELRNREGLSTQLELNDSRLSLQIAQANRAQAARDLQVTRAHVALLPNLPVGVR